MKLAAVVISFGYSNEQLYENVKKYIEYVDLMIIWDNTLLVNKKLTKTFWKSKHPNIVILSTGKNEGIGYALNRSIEFAEKKGYTHLLTMDQDSIWPDFESYKNAVSLDKEIDIAIYAPTIKNQIGDIVIKCNKNDLYAITSGSILDLKKIKIIGLFNEKFFIDEVDNEYCVRVLKKGFHIKVFEDKYLYQQFGDASGSIFFQKLTSHYSPFRTFFQVRNRIWMLRLYMNVLPFKYHAWTILITIIKRSFVILIYEKDKGKKLNAIRKGIIAGICNSPL